MARSAPRRTQAIRLVTRTGCIPGQNVTWAEFCDLVRMAARIRITPEGFPRGWSNASIINSARKIGGGPATLCERCKTEIALANALDAEPDVNRRRRELLARGERRVLPPTAWALFEALYAGRGHPLSGDFLRKESARRLLVIPSISCAGHWPGHATGLRHIGATSTS